MEDIQLFEKLGSGNFGTTYRAMYKGEIVAAKVLLVSDKRNPQMDEDLQKEIANLQILSQDSCNKYVICYIGSFRKVIGSTLMPREAQYIITEYIPGNNLASILQYVDEFLPFTMWPMMYQMLLGLRYIHEKGFAHRDIKPENIMVTPDYNIKYVDFGLSCKRQYAFSPDTCVGPPAGTRMYLPPEVYKDDREESLDMEKAHDIWSLGITFYQMANKYPSYPYDLVNYNPDYAGGIKRPSNYKYDDGRTNTFINGILVVDPDLRPNIEQVIEGFRDDVFGEVWMYKLQ